MWGRCALMSCPALRGVQLLQACRAVVGPAFLAPAGQSPLEEVAASCLGALGVHPWGLGVRPLGPCPAHLLPSCPGPLGAHQRVLAHLAHRGDLEDLWGGGGAQRAADTMDADGEGELAEPAM